MRKASAFISFILAAVLLLGSFPAFEVFAQEPDYVKKDIPTYVFSLDNVRTTACVFSSLLPDVPYVDPVDYMSVIYTSKFSQVDNGDGTVTVNAPNGTMVANLEKNTLYFEDFESFMSNKKNQEGSSLSIKFAKTESSDYIGEFADLTLDLGKYGIELLLYDGLLYLPLPTISVLFASDYNNAEYVDGSIYYLHSMENTAKDGYFDKSSVYNSLTRSPEMAAFTYANLCFSFDYFYGKPTNALLATDVAAKGFDRTLAEYDDTTRMAREKLQSEDICDYMAALVILSYYFDDGGHTVFYNDPLSESTLYQENPFTTEFLQRLLSDDPFYSTAKQMLSKVYYSGAGRDPLNKLRADAYADYEKPLSWNNGISYLLVSGNTAVFVFDSFDADTATQFREALVYAESHDIRNFVVDLSCNGGGLVVSALFMLASMLCQTTGSNTASHMSQKTITGNTVENIAQFDLNLDGEFNDDDKSVGYDLNFSILTSRYSFSSGNLLPVLAHEKGIAIFGEVSGGGACSLEKIYLADAHYIFASSYNKFVTISGLDVDLGAPVDELLVTTDETGTADYSGLYDIDRLGQLTEDFYACHHTEMIKIDRKEATGTEDGNIEYYICSECGKWFSDEEGKTKITDRSSVILPATGEPDHPIVGDRSEPVIWLASGVLSVLILFVIGQRKKKHRLV